MDAWEAWRQKPAIPKVETFGRPFRRAGRLAPNRALLLPQVGSTQLVARDGGEVIAVAWMKHLGVTGIPDFSPQGASFESLGQRPRFGS